MRSIRTKISRNIFVIVFLIIAVISFLSNNLIHQQFREYISEQTRMRVEVIIATLGQQFLQEENYWDLDYIQTAGSLYLYEGYIIKVYDKNGGVIWDAQAHDMDLCNRIMGDISERMRIQYPRLDGEFKSVAYPLQQSGEQVGSVEISYFGPFFLTENDYQFINSLNKGFLLLGLGALILSVVMGKIMAKRISEPILNMVGVTKKIAGGDYRIQLPVETDMREIRMLMESINHLAYSLSEMEHHRKQLTEDVAHELRTPITILQSHMEAMLDGLWEPTKERLQSCYDEVFRIAHLVSDIERLTNVESDSLKLNKQQIPLVEMLDKAVIGFEAELEEKKLKVGISGPQVTVMADKDRLHQVVLNLLSNAVKYSKPGHRIYIETFDGEKEAGFIIRDEGIGIPAQEIPLIFERFYRTDKSRNRTTGGAGIGLAIVKAILDAHEGRVVVESKENQGSSFAVFLPKVSD